MSGDVPRGQYYLAGPMSGIPYGNLPAFDAAARVLRDRGWDLFVPIELDTPAERAAYMAAPDGLPADKSPGGSWGDLLARDVKLIADKVAGLILLDGWISSRGARLEVFVGLLCGKQFFRYYESLQSVHPLHRAIVLARFINSIRGLGDK